jgi:probable HAF family extracellular repeat protein
MKSQFVNFLLATTLSLLNAASAGASLLYHLTDLSTLGGSDSYSYAINSLGQVVGSSLIGAGPTERAFIYSGGTMLEVGGLVPYATDINTAGQIVGDGVFPSSPNPLVQGFLYSGGVTTPLGVLTDGPESEANAINASGAVVGTSDTISAGEPSGHAFLYHGGPLVDLGTLGGPSSEANDINSAGQIVGEADLATSPSVLDRAFLYSGGVMTDLTTATSGALTHANKINDLGQIAGTGPTGAVLYSGGTVTELGTSALPNGINNSAQIVGSPPSTATTGHGFIYSAGTLYDLNDLLDISGKDWTIRFAADINDNGWIAAGGSFRGGNQHALLLIPVSVPEPSSLFLSAIAGMGFMFALANRKLSRC